MVGANEAYLRVTMRRREDLVGRNMFEAFPESEDGAGTADARPLRDSLERVVRERGVDHIPLILYPIRGPDGQMEERYWSATHTPLLDGNGEVAFVLQHTEDVTELHRLRGTAAAQRRTPGLTQIEGDVFRRAMAVQEANQSLDEERRHLRRLFEQAPGFMAVLSGPDHVFELANSAFAQVVGPRQIVGKTVVEALPEMADQGFVELLDQAFASGQPYVGRDVRILLHQTEGPSVERFLDFVYQPIVGPDGETLGIFVQGNDITEQKRAEEALAEYRDHLEQLVRERTRALEESEMQRRQAQKLETIGQLTGGVAHDFNNLLAVIVGNLELARKRVDDPRIVRLLENALHAGERGAKLTHQLLAFARKQALALEPTDLPQSIFGMRDLLSRTIGPAIKIRTQLAHDLWPVVTDRNQLEVALLNLAINARDAMPKGGVLTISAENVGNGDLPEDVASGEYVRISVCDTGMGIPDEIRAKVFEPFFTTKEVGKGTGLGLSQIYGFAKQQGGTVTLESAVGRGTSFHLYIPRAGVEPDFVPAAPIVASLRKRCGSHILVVDDDAEVRNFVSEGLKDMGFVVTEAGSGETGLDLLRRDRSVNLVLADFAMPGLDGLGFIRSAREVLPEVPAVLMTGYADAGRLNEARPPEVQVVMKPFRFAALLTAVQQSLDSADLAARRRVS